MPERLHRRRALRVVIVGYGPVAARLVDSLLPAVRDHSIRLVVVGAEYGAAYNRVMLGDIAVGKTDREALTLGDLDELAADGVIVRTGTQVVEIDRERHFVELSNGEEHAYDRLVFATGARALIPPLHGLRTSRADEAIDPELPRGITALRDLGDADRVRQAIRRGQRIVVLGGGVLGMEIALAAEVAGAAVTLVHQGQVPMERNLDHGGAFIVSRTLRQRGIEVIADGDGSGVTMNHQGFVSLKLIDGREVPGDLLLLSCGARARTELAQQAGIKVAKGIVVDHELSSWSDPAISAIGDCAQVVCENTDCPDCQGDLMRLPAGVIAPGWAQAEWLGTTLTAEAQLAERNHGIREATPLPSEQAPVMILKAPGLNVVSAGSIYSEPWELDNDDVEVAQWSDPAHGKYVKMVTRGGALEGMISVGMPRTGAELTLLYERGSELPSDRSVLLRHDGPDYEAGGGNDADATICRCNGVSAGQISTAVTAGHCTLAAVAGATRAGTGCGGCRDRILELIELNADKSSPADNDSPAERQNQEAVA